jgi:hypothetical protein
MAMTPMVPERRMKRKGSGYAAFTLDRGTLSG